MDDDLVFHNFKNKIGNPLLAYFYYKFYTKDYAGSFEKSKPNFFFERLEYYLNEYKPEVMSLTQLDNNPVNRLDTAAMRNNSFVRRSGFFDAQFTVMSNYAANKIMPYDTSISGWSSSQIPVYLYAFHVFASKAINLSQLAVANGFHVGAYAENYDGMLDCKKMIKRISEVTNKDYSSLGSVDNNHAVSYLYGEEIILAKFPKPGSIENYKANYKNNLLGLEKLLHPNVVA
ncbi:MAG: hypothetical protein EOP45_15910 [Sphingobacteriaceae bacterium]|nr:MAG: hypothetical protein EOP45_15910 [Sphingobacteriaceae bacterium]